MAQNAQKRHKIIYIYIIYNKYIIWTLHVQRPAFAILASVISATIILAFAAAQFHRRPTAADA